jgi:hypothetical protein
MGQGLVETVKLFPAPEARLIFCREAFSLPSWAFISASTCVFMKIKQVEVSGHLIHLWHRRHPSPV